MKLTTKTIKQLVTNPGQLWWFLAQYEEDGRTDIAAHITLVKNWNRGTKCLLGNLCQSVGGKTIGMALDNIRDEDPIVLDPEPLAAGCVVRYLVCPEYTLDCYVISDPLDERVLQIFWHHD